MSSSNTDSPTQDGANAADDKPRLTEEEKKQNHIASGGYCHEASLCL
jgi:heteromeric Ino2p/Ino4p transcription factor